MIWLSSLSEGLNSVSGWLSFASVSFCTSLLTSSHMFSITSTLLAESLCYELLLRLLAMLFALYWRPDSGCTPEDTLFLSKFLWVMTFIILGNLFNFVGLRSSLPLMSSSGCETLTERAMFLLLRRGAVPDYEGPCRNCIARYALSTLLFFVVSTPLKQF